MSEKKPFPKLALPWAMVCVGLVIGWQALGELMDLGALGTSRVSLYAFLGVLLLFVFVPYRRAFLTLACVLFPVALGLSYSEFSEMKAGDLFTHGYAILGLGIVMLGSMVLCENKTRSVNYWFLVLVNAGASAVTLFLVTLSSKTVLVVLAGALVVIGGLVAALLLKSGSDELAEG